MNSQYIIPDFFFTRAWSVYSWVWSLYPWNKVSYTRRCNVYTHRTIGNHIPMGDTCPDFFFHRSEFLTCNNKFLPWLEFSPVGKFLPYMQQIFTMVIDVWPCANWAMVANNFSTVIEVLLIDIALIEVSCTHVLPYCRTSQCHRTFIPLSVFLWNNLSRSHTNLV